MLSMPNVREMQFGGEIIHLHPSAALYFPQYKTLVVSDLHLEKGSFLGQTGAPVPLYDTLDTLLRLKQLLDDYQPAQVILLGDTFHDRSALERLPAKECEILLSMAQSIPNWWWVAGNHDADLKLNLPGQACRTLRVGNLNLSHEPVSGLTPLVVGHFHPKTTTSIAGHKIKGKVFIHDQSLLIMPAFGSYTGGLLTDHPVYTKLFSGRPDQYVIVNNKIWKTVPSR